MAKENFVPADKSKSIIRFGQHKDRLDYIKKVNNMGYISDIKLEERATLSKLFSKNDNKFVFTKFNISNSNYFTIVINTGLIIFSVSFVFDFKFIFAFSSKYQFV